MIAKDFNAISLFTVDACNVYHSYIHTDIANIFGFLSVDKAVTMSITEVSVKPICITYWDSSYHTVSLKDCLSAVTNTLSSRKMMQLKDCSL